MKHNGIVYDVTGNYDTEYYRLANAFQNADAIIVGAGIPNDADSQNRTQIL